jgi:phosphoribosylglycinamide formyltransferase 2
MKILLLGSGELGKEFVISAKRLGQYVIAVDSYNDAPAQQVADAREVISMLDGNALDEIVDRHRPDMIVPEIEAIRTERFYDYEKHGIQVVPSARAANFTMNRKAIRNLAADTLKLKTARYAYADTFEKFKEVVAEIGIPCVVKPLMSSSGKGQSVIHVASEILQAWEYAMHGTRGDLKEVIVEEFIAFESEITLLTVTQKNGVTLFCPPIGHRQERGDYQESWQPHAMSAGFLEEAKRMADAVTRALSGVGLWGVEFFLTDQGVYFSELSPRPHDTGMVTLAGTQNLSEFDLHIRAILGLPIPEIVLERIGASAVILAKESSSKVPAYTGMKDAISMNNTDIRIFGKPSTRPYRRMGVSLAYDRLDGDIAKVKANAIENAKKVRVV